MSGMVLFWIVAGGLCLAVGLVLWRAAGRATSDARSATASDIAVYKDQLAEVDRDLARGIVTEDEAEQVRIEISRRLLAADAAGAETSTEAKTGGTMLVAISLVAALAVTAGVYLTIGAPGYPDLPIAERLATAAEIRANRPSQAAAEADVPPVMVPGTDPRLPELVEQLRAALAERLDDLEGYILLARNEAALGNFAAAHAAQARVVELRGTANDYADYADLLILAAGGYVSPEAEEALLQALNRDSSNGAARYYAGLLAAQTGRPDQAFNLWRPLLEESQPDAPWVGPIRA